MAGGTPALVHSLPGAMCLGLCLVQSSQFEVPCLPDNGEHLSYELEFYGIQCLFLHVFSFDLLPSLRSYSSLISALSSIACRAAIDRSAFAWRSACGDGRRRHWTLVPDKCSDGATARYFPYCLAVSNAVKFWVLAKGSQGQALDPLNC